MLSAIDTIETFRGAEYRVRRISGAVGQYRCPGCDQLFSAATGHIVAWPVDDVDSRRHWHANCWAARAERRPGIERSRNAPRYG
jgi:hypothetical protein